MVTGGARNDRRGGDRAIVCTLDDAVRCCMGTEIGDLVSGNRIIRKDQQNPAPRAELRG
jgi:hypothetical protein